MWNAWSITSNHLVMIAWLRQVSHYHPLSMKRSNSMVEPDTIVTTLSCSWEVIWCAPYHPRICFVQGKCTTATRFWFFQGHLIVLLLHVDLIIYFVPSFPILPTTHLSTAAVFGMTNSLSCTTLRSGTFFDVVLKLPRGVVYFKVLQNFRLVICWFISMVSLS